jgi:hypothetical protein
MVRFIFFILLIISVPFANCFAAGVEALYPNAVNKLYLDPEKISEYNLLAQAMGFEYDKKYTYTEYAEVKRNNTILNHPPSFLMTFGRR